MAPKTNLANFLTLGSGAALAIVLAIISDVVERYKTHNVVNTLMATWLALKWRLTKFIGGLQNPVRKNLELNNVVTHTALAVAMDLDVFRLVASKTKAGGAPREWLIKMLGLREPSATILLHVLCAFGHLKRSRWHNNNYFVPPGGVSTFVLPNNSRGSYEAHLVRYFNRILCRGSVMELATRAFKENRNVGIDLYPADGKSGESAIWYSRLSDYPGVQEEFHLYMDAISNDSKRALSYILRFSEFPRILDFCGSTGNNCKQILQQSQPHAKKPMHCTVVDLPSVVSATEPEFAAKNPELVGSVSFKSFDLFHGQEEQLLEQFEAPYDLAMFLHTVVPAPQPLRRRMFRLAFNCIRPGGWVLLFTSFVPPLEDSGKRVALKNFVHRIFVYDDWRFPTAAELEDDLRAIGFENYFLYPLVVGEESIIMARRPLDSVAQPTTLK